MAREAEVILQRYKDGDWSDARAFRRADGLTWKLGDRVRTKTDLRPWLADSRSAGRLPVSKHPGFRLVTFRRRAIFSVPCRLRTYATGGPRRSQASAISFPGWKFSALMESPHGL
jgi:hypothetical protein